MLRVKNHIMRRRRKNKCIIFDFYIFHPLLLKSKKFREIARLLFKK